MKRLYSVNRTNSGYHIPNPNARLQRQIAESTYVNVKQTPKRRKCKPKLSCPSHRRNTRCLAFPSKASKISELENSIQCSVQLIDILDTPTLPR